jgi:DNA-binding transcriptional ArsR family regulator
MPTINRLRQAAIALCLALPPFAASAVTASAEEAPARAAPGDPVYAIELRAYLESVRTYQRAFDAMPRGGDVFEREFAAAFLASMTADRFYARALPVYARHIPPRHAAVLGAMAHKKPVPVGKQQSALQSYWDAEKQARPELAQVWRDLAADYYRSAQQRAMDEIRHGVADLAEHRGTAYTPKLNKVGLSYLDRMAWLAVNNSAQQMNANLAMENGCRQAGMETRLLPANLLAENGIAAARQAVDGCERALESMEKMSEAGFTQMKQGFAALNLPNKAAIADTLDKKSREYYDYLQKLGALNRQTLEAQRRLLSLVEAQRSHIQLQDGAVGVDDDAVLAELNRIVEAVAASETATNDFIYQTRQGGPLRDMDLHDGITAPRAD